MPNTSEFLMKRVEKSRASQRAVEFLNRSKNSISLSGKDVATLSGCTDKKKLHEVVLAGEENVERFDGDAVTASDVYTSSADVVWEDNGAVKFRTPEGILLSASQFDYIQKYGPLPKYRYFGKSNNKDVVMGKVWRDLHRRSTEARKDKSKDILTSP